MENSEKPEHWDCPNCKETVRAKNKMSLRSAKYYHRKVKCSEKTKVPETPPAPSPLEEKIKEIDEKLKTIDDYCMIVLGLYSSVFNTSRGATKQNLLKDYTFYHKLRDAFLETHKEDIKKMQENKEKTKEEKERRYISYVERLERYQYEKEQLIKELGYTPELPVYTGL